MRLFVAWILVFVAALGVAWLLAGRLLALLVDRIFTVRLARLPVSLVQYDGGAFRIGSLQMTFGSTSNLRYALALGVDAANRVVLTTGGRSFILGPRTNLADPAGRPDIDFVPEAGDRLDFTAVRSAIGWPTPFEYNFMTPRSPWWKRYVYYRLIWEKRSEARLEMLWRYEQRYIESTGWSEPAMMWNSQIGLLRVDIRSATLNLAKIVDEYLARTKGWKRAEYRIEERGASPDGGSDVIAVIHIEDERSSRPGAGRSVQLYVDRRSHEVIQELGGQ